MIYPKLDDKQLAIDTIVESLRLKMVCLSKTHFESRNLFAKKHSGNRHNEKCLWFDDECKKQKSLFNNVRKSYQAALKLQTDSSTVVCLNDLKTAYFKQRRFYKKTLKRKKKDYLDNEKLNLWNLKGEDPKALWKMLKNITKNEII